MTAMNGYWLLTKQPQQSYPPRQHSVGLRIGSVTSLTRPLIQRCVAVQAKAVSYQIIAFLHDLSRSVRPA
jgi:hypothetical protein